MARKRRMINPTCPYCGESAYKKEYVLTKRNTLQYFHRECYMAEVEKNKKRQEAIDDAKVSSDG